jgi:hypothetical protein
MRRSFAYDAWLTFAMLAASVLVIVAFIGCDSTEPSNVIEVERSSAFYPMKVHSVEVNGHDYLRFDCSRSHATSIDIIHDPDCRKCKTDR